MTEPSSLYCLQLLNMSCKQGDMAVKNAGYAVRETFRDAFRDCGQWWLRWRTAHVAGRNGADYGSLTAEKRRILWQFGSRETAQTMAAWQQRNGACHAVRQQRNGAYYGCLAVEKRRRRRLSQAVRQQRNYTDMTVWQQRNGAYYGSLAADKRRKNDSLAAEKRRILWL